MAGLYVAASSLERGVVKSRQQAKQAQWPSTRWVGIRPGSLSEILEKTGSASDFLGHSRIESFGRIAVGAFLEFVPPNTSLSTTQREKFAPRRYLKTSLLPEENRGTGGRMPDLRFPICKFAFEGPVSEADLHKLIDNIRQTPS
jgi:hypothetical protein